MNIRRLKYDFLEDFKFAYTTTKFYSKLTCEQLGTKNDHQYLEKFSL